MWPCIRRVALCNHREVVCGEYPVWGGDGGLQGSCASISALSLWLLLLYSVQRGTRCCRLLRDATRGVLKTHAAHALRPCISRSDYRFVIVVHYMDLLYQLLLAISPPCRMLHTLQYSALLSLRRYRRRQDATKGVGYCLLPSKSSTISVSHLAAVSLLRRALPMLSYSRRLSSSSLVS